VNAVPDSAQVMAYAEKMIARGRESAAKPGRKAAQKR
jgi:hypothetical protein